MYYKAQRNVPSRQKRNPINVNTVASRHNPRHARISEGRHRGDNYSKAGVWYCQRTAGKNRHGLGMMEGVGCTWYM